MDNRTPPSPAVRASVESVHADLAHWLGTAAPDAVFDRFAEAQHDTFTMVTTAGEILAKAELLHGLRGARNAQPGLTIEIDELETLLDDGSTVVIRFLERHHVGPVTTARRVTAVLDAAGERPLWRTVHETPLA
ncbi:hypothetical protein ACIGO9_13245 [Nocardia asteroides]|uniref:hypothetical protein n=1 Tax=Nocardia asteroides TaxID=1824 RepID=UPI0037CAB4F5